MCLVEYFSWVETQSEDMCSKEEESQLLKLSGGDKDRETLRQIEKEYKVQKYSDFWNGFGSLAQFYFYQLILHIPTY